MNIELLAQEIVKVQGEREVIEGRYVALRDQMFNALNSQENNTYIWNGYKFSKLSMSSYLSINKEKVISALHSAGLTQEVIDAILSSSLVEIDRSPGIRVSKAQA